MTRRPVVHIGIHKTASTWLQKEFFPQVSGCYLAPRKLVRQALLEPRFEEFDPSHARSALDERAGDRRLIISEENLSGYPHNGGVGGALPAIFADRLQRAFPDAFIVVFLRAQPAAIASCYGQYVRSGGTASLSDYLNSQHRDLGARRHWYKVPSFDLRHFRYSALLGHYREHASSGLMKVYLYEDLASDPQALVNRLCADLAFRPMAQNLSHRTSHVSLSPTALKLLRTLNHFTRRSVANKHYVLHVPKLYEKREPIVRRLLGARAQRRTDARAVLGQNLFEQLNASFADDNLEVARTWGLDMMRHGYPWPEGDPGGS